MKKYTVVGVIGLLAVLGIGWYLYANGKLSLLGGTGKGTIWDRVPANGDQLLYLDVDQDLLEVAGRMEIANPENDQLQEVLGTLEQAVVYQHSEGTGVTRNLLFLEGKESISIEDLQDLGLINGTDGFEYESLGNNLWVYGDTDSLAYFREYKGDGASTNDAIKIFLNAFRAGEYNIGFYSTPVKSLAKGALATNVASQLQHTHALSRLRLENPFGRIVLQFGDGLLRDAEKAFSPRLTNFAGPNNILYLEIGDLLSVVGVSEQQLAMFLPVVMGQASFTSGASLTSNDYGLLAKALHDNVAISMTPQASMIGVGIQLIFADPAVYDALLKLSPLWKSLTAPLGGGTENIQEIVGDGNTVTYAIGGPETGSGLFAPLPAMPVITLGKTEDVAYVLIFQEGLMASTDGATYTLPATDRTSAVFRFDNQALTAAFKQSQFMQLAQQAQVGQTAFQTGVVVGAIDTNATTDQIVVSFSVE